MESSTGWAIGEKEVYVSILHLKAKNRPNQRFLKWIYFSYLRQMREVVHVSNIKLRLPTGEWANVREHMNHIVNADIGYFPCMKSVKAKFVHLYSNIGNSFGNSELGLSKHELNSSMTKNLSTSSYFLTLRLVTTHRLRRKLSEMLNSPREWSWGIFLRIVKRP